MYEFNDKYILSLEVSLAKDLLIFFVSESKSSAPGTVLSKRGNNPKILKEGDRKMKNISGTILYK